MQNTRHGQFKDWFQTFSPPKYGPSKIIRVLNFAKVSCILTDLYGIKPIGNQKNFTLYYVCERKDKF